MATGPIRKKRATLDLEKTNVGAIVNYRWASCIRKGCNDCSEQGIATYSYVLLCRIAGPHAFERAATIFKEKQN